MATPRLVYFELSEPETCSIGGCDNKALTGRIVMGFMSEIEEEYEKMKRDKVARNKMADSIAEFLGEDMTDEQKHDLDVLRNPDDYDDFGHLRHFR